METRANFLLIGMFTLSVIVAGFAFVFWFSNAGQGGPHATYRVVFDGSVSGLKTGGDVLFNGIRVGEVTALALNPKDLRQVVATITVEAGIPVRADTHVGLDVALLTSTAAVALRGGTLDAPALVAQNGEPPVLTADQSSTEGLTQAARDVLRRLDAFIADNEGSLRNTVQNMETVTATLARNSERIDNMLAGLEKFTGGADGKGEMNEAARALRTLSENLDQRTADLTARLSRLTDTGQRELEILVADSRRTLADIDRAVKNFDSNPQRVLFGPGPSAAPPSNGRR